MPDGGLPPARIITFAPETNKLTDGLGCRDALTAPYARWPTTPAVTYRTGDGSWRNPRPWMGGDTKPPEPPGVPPELVTRNGRAGVVGRREPVYLVPGPTEPDEANADDEVVDASEPESSLTWADTLAGYQGQPRAPNQLPALPPWATPRFRIFLETARLTDRQIRQHLRSRDQAARLVAERAEHLASSYTDADKRRDREPATERAYVLLMYLLQLADEIQGVTRTDGERFAARRETVKRAPRSKRRTEMLALYGELIDRCSKRRTPRDDRRQSDIMDIYDDACRVRVHANVHNSRRQGWHLWDPAPKNKANSPTCGETRLFCGHYSLEGHAISTSEIHNERSKTPATGA